ncbi:MAG: class I SAM-dependent methyltransferase [Beijerinckiaceae bacterium]|jgi:predicted nicotinamide N-methyase
MNEHERAAFIRAHTHVRPVPLVPSISIHMADEATALWSKTEDELGEIGLAPPFWAFAWAGGQALARYTLDHPHETRGKRILDFAAGSGLVAIAAAHAGAAQVEACDIDAFAATAIRLNSAQNGANVQALLQDIVGRDEGWDVVLAGDVSYERDMARRVTDWLRTLTKRGARVLVGDPGRAYLARALMEPLARYDAPTSRDIEDADVKPTTVFALRAD